LRPWLPREVCPLNIALIGRADQSSTSTSIKTRADVGLAQPDRESCGRPGGDWF